MCICIICVSDWLVCPKDIFICTVCMFVPVVFVHGKHNIYDRHLGPPAIKSGVLLCGKYMYYKLRLWVKLLLFPALCPNLRFEDVSINLLSHIFTGRVYWNSIKKSELLSLPPPNGFPMHEFEACLCLWIVSFYEFVILLIFDWFNFFNIYFGLRCWCDCRLIVCKVVKVIGLLRQA